MFLNRARNFITLSTLYLCQLLRQITGKKFIYVIGDSHTLAFQDCKLKVRYLGAVTAYNLVNENSSSQGREKLFKVINLLKQNDTVLLVFGEIDVRIHVYNQYMKNNRKISIEKLVSRIVNNYGQVIDELIARKIKVCIYNIVPPGPQANIYNYPYYADWKTRLTITKIMNNKLRNYCKKSGICFVDIFDEVIDRGDISEIGFRRKTYVFDDVHLNDKVTELVLAKLKQVQN